MLPTLVAPFTLSASTSPEPIDTTLRLPAPWMSMSPEPTDAAASPRMLRPTARPEPTSALKTGAPVTSASPEPTFTCTDTWSGRVAVRFM